MDLKNNVLFLQSIPLGLVHRPDGRFRFDTRFQCCHGCICMRCNSKFDKCKPFDPNQPAWWRVSGQGDEEYCTILGEHCLYTAVRRRCRQPLNVDGAGRLLRAFRWQRQLPLDLIRSCWVQLCYEREMQNIKRLLDLAPFFWKEKNGVYTMQDRLYCSA